MTRENYSTREDVYKAAGRLMQEAKTLNFQKEYNYPTAAAKTEERIKKQLGDVAASGSQVLLAVLLMGAQHASGYPETGGYYDYVEPKW